MAEAIDFYLVKETYVKDQIGQLVASLSRRQLLGERESVTRAEWSAAGQNGLQAQYRVNMFAPDYEGEKILQMVVNGQPASFGIYRTFRDGDTLELYLEEKPGNTNDPTVPTEEPDGGN